MPETNRPTGDDDRSGPELAPPTFELQLGYLGGAYSAACALDATTPTLGGFLLWAAERIERHTPSKAPRAKPPDGSALPPVTCRSCLRPIAVPANSNTSAPFGYVHMETGWAASYEKTPDGGEMHFARPVA